MQFAQHRQFHVTLTDECRLLGANCDRAKSTTQLVLMLTLTVILTLTLTLIVTLTLLFTLTNPNANTNPKLLQTYNAFPMAPSKLHSIRRSFSGI